MRSGFNTKSANPAPIPSNAIARTKIGIQLPVAAWRTFPSGTSKQCPGKRPAHGLSVGIETFDLQPHVRDAVARVVAHAPGRSGLRGHFAAALDRWERSQLALGRDLVARARDAGNPVANGAQPGSGAVGDLS